MKVLAISGSPRREGNTVILLNKVLEPIKKAGIECELLSLSGMKLFGCTACTGCRKEPPESPRCVMETRDDFKGIIQKMLDADAIILGSPVYFGSATPEIMAVLHRAGYAIRGTQRQHLKGKIGAAVVSARRAGHNFTLAQLNYFFQINGMITPGSSYWNLGFGGAAGEVENDKEAMTTMSNLGENILDLLKRLR